MEQLLRTCQHPVEGCAYLVYIGLFIRWRHPQNWNNFLGSISVPPREEFHGISPLKNQEERVVLPIQKTAVHSQ